MESPINDLTFEPVRDPQSDPAVGLILESLRRREPTPTVR
jgi:hypothetical protein